LGKTIFKVSSSPPFTQPAALAPVMFEGVELDDDDPAAWPDVAAQRLDHALRCAICGDLFTMPVSLARCTHTCE
jgi:hypothetical protein